MSGNANHHQHQGAPQMPGAAGPNAGASQPLYNNNMTAQAQHLAGASAPPTAALPFRPPPPMMAPMTPASGAQQMMLMQQMMLNQQRNLMASNPMLAAQANANFSMMQTAAQASNPMLAAAQASNPMLAAAQASNPMLAAAQAQQLQHFAAQQVAAQQQMNFSLAAARNLQEQQQKLRTFAAGAAGVAPPAQTHLQLSGGVERHQQQPVPQNLPSGTSSTSAGGNLAPGASATPSASTGAASTASVVPSAGGPPAAAQAPTQAQAKAGSVPLMGGIAPGAMLMPGALAGATTSTTASTASSTVAAALMQQQANTTTGAGAARPVMGVAGAGGATSSATNVLLAPAGAAASTTSIGAKTIPEKIMEKRMMETKKQELLKYQEDQKRRTLHSLKKCHLHTKPVPRKCKFCLKYATDVEQANLQIEEVARETNSKLEALQQQGAALAQGILQAQSGGAGAGPRSTTTSASGHQLLHAFQPNHSHLVMLGAAGAGGLPTAGGDPQQMLSLARAGGAAAGAYNMSAHHQQLLKLPYTNEKTFNLPMLVLGQIEKSTFFHELQNGLSTLGEAAHLPGGGARDGKCDTVGRLVGKAVRVLDNCDVYLHHSFTETSSFMACLLRLLLLKPTGEELKDILLNTENPYARLLGFVLIRFVLDHERMWAWYSSFFLDRQEVKFCRHEHLTMGEIVERLFLEDRYGDGDCVFPRIPHQVRQKRGSTLVRLEQQRDRAKEHLARAEQDPKWLAVGKRVEACSSGDWLFGHIVSANEYAAKRDPGLLSRTDRIDFSYDSKISSLEDHREQRELFGATVFVRLEDGVCEEFPLGRIVFPLDDPIEVEPNVEALFPTSSAPLQVAPKRSESASGAAGPAAAGDHGNPLTETGNSTDNSRGQEAVVDHKMSVLRTTADLAPQPQSEELEVKKPKPDADRLEPPARPTASQEDHEMLVDDESNNAVAAREKLSTSALLGENFGTSKDVVVEEPHAAATRHTYYNVDQMGSSASSAPPPPPPPPPAEDVLMEDGVEDLHLRDRLGTENKSSASTSLVAGDLQHVDLLVLSGGAAAAAEIPIEVGEGGGPDPGPDSGPPPPPPPPPGVNAAEDSQGQKVERTCSSAVPETENVTPGNEEKRPREQELILQGASKDPLAGGAVASSSSGPRRGGGPAAREDDSFIHASSTTTGNRHRTTGNFAERASEKEANHVSTTSTGHHRAAREPRGERDAGYHRDHHGTTSSGHNQDSRDHYATRDHPRDKTGAARGGHRSRSRGRGDHPRSRSCGRGDHRGGQHHHHSDRHHGAARQRIRRRDLVHQKDPEPTPEEIEAYFTYQKKQVLATGKAYSTRPHDFKLATGLSGIGAEERRMGAYAPEVIRVVQKNENLKSVAVKRDHELGQGPGGAAGVEKNLGGDFIDRYMNTKSYAAGGNRRDPVEGPETLKLGKTRR
ncbi:unnamed protein product [Amoebophrya sp. A120]|nr:unnamed protein product [Amoebophrya sp. A120]|eukprot:GSA120T00000117001.1